MGCWTRRAIVGAVNCGRPVPRWHPGPRAPPPDPPPPGADDPTVLPGCGRRVVLLPSPRGAGRGAGGEGRTRPGPADPTPSPRPSPPRTGARGTDPGPRRKMCRVVSPQGGRDGAVPSPLVGEGRVGGVCLTLGLLLGLLV